MVGPADAPGATGWVNGGSHCGLPGCAKKPVHWAAVTCFSVATVGLAVAGDVVPGSHAAIWSASVLGRNANVMSASRLNVGRGAAALRVTVVAVTLSATAPAAMPAPKADMPTLMLPVPPKVSSAVADESVGGRGSQAGQRPVGGQART